MSVAPNSPYTFGSSSGGSKGPGIGKSIGDAIDAISGLKAHQATLEHMANEGQKNHERNLETIKLNHSLGEKSAAANVTRAKSLEAQRHKNSMAATTGLVKHAQTLSKGAQPGTKLSLRPGAIDFTVKDSAAKPAAAKTAAAKKPAAPKTTADGVIKPVNETPVKKPATKRTK